MGECKQKKICHICEAPFKMSRGCFLEKRCHGCRILGLRKHDLNFYSKRYQHGNYYATYVYQPPPILGGYGEFKHEDLPKNVEDEEICKLMLDQLVTYREKEVIRMRFGLGDGNYTLAEIAESYGIGRERIRQIEEKALKKLKHPRISSIACY